MTKCSNLELRTQDFEVPGVPQITKIYILSCRFELPEVPQTNTKMLELRTQNSELRAQNLRFYDGANLLDIYIDTHIFTYMHACMHACIHTYIHTYILSAKEGLLEIRKQHFPVDFAPYLGLGTGVGLK